MPQQHHLQTPQDFAPFSLTLQGTHAHIDAQVRGIRFLTESRMPIEIQLTISVSVGDYAQHIDPEAWFGLAPECRNESALSAFDASRPLEIDLLLTPEVLPFAQLSFNTPQQMLAALQSDAPNQREQLYRRARSWHALHVKQQVDTPPHLSGTLKMGYSTTWAQQLKAQKPAQVRQLAPMMAQVHRYFQSKVAHLELDAERSALKFSYPLSIDYAECLVHVREEYKQVIFHARAAYAIPAEHLTRAMEFVIDTNTTVKIGSLDLDRQNRVLFFRTYLDVDEPTIKDSWLELLFDGNIYQLNKYYKTLRGLLASAE